MPLEPENFSQSNKRPLHLENPWTQVMYRWYQAKQKHSPALLAMDEQLLDSERRDLAYLQSNHIKDYLEAYPEKRTLYERRKQETVANIQEQQGIIAHYHASVARLKNKLIRFGFLDARGQSLVE